MEIKTFHGGVHPAEHKELSKESPLTQLLPKGELVYMTNQHIGKPASPVVKKGDHVLAGQIIAEAGGFVSANIVSSVSGTVKAVEPRKNASGGSAMAAVASGLLFSTTTTPLALGNSRSIYSMPSTISEALVRIS